MATRYGYGSISDEGYLGFARDLGQEEWGLIDISMHTNTEKRLDDPCLLPISAFWKLKLDWLLSDLAQARGTTSSEELSALDEVWDASQRQLSLMLAFHEAGRDAAKSDAAARLRNLLLRGGGTAQTNLSYQQEVDFGAAQLSLLESGQNPQASIDASLLGLGPVLDGIRSATNALAQAVGRMPGGSKPEAPSRRLKAARNECRDAFEHIHAELDYALSRTKPGAGRDKLERLLAPMSSLLERHAPKPSKKEEAASGAASGLAEA